MNLTYRLLGCHFRVLLLLLILIQFSASVNAESINLAEGRSYSLQIAASDRYPDTGNLLTDGKFGADRGLDCGERLCAPGWVGFDRGLPVITLDLANAHRIERVSVSFLSFPSKGVKPPTEITLQSSFDGQHWISRGRLQQVETRFELIDQNWKSRFLRFIVARNQWTFIDEIKVMGEPELVSNQEKEEPLKRILVVTSVLSKSDERQLRLTNILEGIGSGFDMIEVGQLDDCDLFNYQLLIFAGSSNVPLTIFPSQELHIATAVAGGTNVLWIGEGIWGSFKTTVLPDTFGVRYIRQDSNEVIGVRFAKYLNLDDKQERLPLKHETMWVVEPVASEVLGWYLDDDGRQLKIPFITRMKGGEGHGIALYISLPLLDRWKNEEDYFSYARAEILTRAIRSLLTDGAVGKHPVTNSHDAVFLLRLEDYTPGGSYMGHESRNWLIRMERLLALTEKHQMPLNIGIIPKYNHPFLQETHDWGENDQPVRQLKQMAQKAFDRGGSLIVHGYDHQNGDGIDDYSGGDWEMWDEDAQTFLPLEQQQAITDNAYAEIVKQWGIKPVIWETPHYTSNTDTFRAARRSGFRYFSESDTKIFPNWNGYQNVASGLMLNIPETVGFFLRPFDEVKKNTLTKQFHILPRIVRMHALFLVFYHNMSDTMNRALENLLMTTGNFDLWKPSMEAYAIFWEKRQKVIIESSIDRNAKQIRAVICNAFDGFTVAVQLPAGTTLSDVMIDGEVVNAKKRQMAGSWILYPVLGKGHHNVVVMYQ